MRVLVVSNMYPGRNPKFEYAGVFVKEQTEELKKIEGVDCDLYVIDGFRSKFQYLFGSVFVLFKVLLGKYDVVHVHYGLSALFTLLIPFKKWDNVILTLHGGDILHDQGKQVQVWLTKRILEKVGKVITLNDTMNSVVSQFVSDYVVLPCGVDMDFFNVQDDTRRNNIVLFPGRKDREVKNFPLFEQVINIYNSKYSSLVPIVMDGMSREEVRDIMSTATVMLMTSISEGSPQAIKEALSCDMSVVSSNVGDVRVVTGGVAGTGIFDLGEEPQSVADLLHKTLEDAKKARGARRNRVKEFGLSNNEIAQRLVALYREVSIS